MQVTEFVKIRSLNTSVYKIPTEHPESDGTLKWNSCTLILVEIEGGGKKGLGYSYGNEAIGYYVEKVLKEIVIDSKIMDIPAIWNSMTAAVRNDGNSGIAAMAIAAVDNALWDLKGKILGIPLATLLGMRRAAMPVYASGGFTSYSIDRLQKQVEEWVEMGFDKIKIKIGREPEKDVERVKAARAAMGKEGQLFVDANGAYNAKQAIEKGWQFIEFGVTWFEEPVPSSDFIGLQFIRKRMPPTIKVAAGEYGYTLPYYERMLDAGAVDVLQADATRCGGISGFLKAADMAFIYQNLFSSHCAPAIHLHAALTVDSFYSAEYFYDHYRIEELLFEGVQKPKDGLLYPDLERPGCGLELKKADAAEYKIY